MTKQRILIPVDGSAFSRHIIEHVCRLFRPADAELLLLHVAAPPEAMVPNPPRTLTDAWPVPLYTAAQDAARAQHPIYATQMEASASANLEAELRPEIQHLEEAGYAVTLTVQFGEPAATIVATAEEAGVDLVAMATHGRTGLRHLLLGSVAKRVLRDVRVPVLIVRPPEDIA